MTVKIDKHIAAPNKNSANRRRHKGFSWRTSHQCRHMPIIDSENVTNTLIEYISTSATTFPPVSHSAPRAEKPITSTPLCAANRSERFANQWGTHESRPCWPTRADHR